jgi:NADPH:quinone reductase-like Zn-dependent oxidoreductase
MIPPTSAEWYGVVNRVPPGAPPGASGRPLAEDEVLIQVKAAGVANWDEFGREVTDWAAGDEVITHPLPLRDQGTRSGREIVSW